MKSPCTERTHIRESMLTLLVLFPAVLNLVDPCTNWPSLPIVLPIQDKQKASTHQKDRVMEWISKMYHKAKRMRLIKQLKNLMLSHQQSGEIYLIYRWKRWTKRKLKRCLKDPRTRILARTQTIRVNVFTNVKDATLKCNRSNVIYQFTRPGCRISYIGKTERT